MAGADSFLDRTRHLLDEVGDGHIVAGCLVDQVYAQNQHENLRFRHTRGQAQYLREPFLADTTRLMASIARSVLSTDGSHLRREMINTSETMAGYVRKFAPRDPDIGDVLANSGSPWVTDAGREIYRRPPIQPREREDHE